MHHGRNSTFVDRLSAHPLSLSRASPKSSVGYSDLPIPKLNRHRSRPCIQYTPHRAGYCRLWYWPCLHGPYCHCRNSVCRLHLSRFRPGHPPPPTVKCLFSPFHRSSMKLPSSGIDPVALSTSVVSPSVHQPWLSYVFICSGKLELINI